MPRNDGCAPKTREMPRACNVATGNGLEELAATRSISTLA